MLRQKRFNYIEEKLGALAFRISAKGKLNILDLHVHAEDFYKDLCNIVFDWNLRNANEVHPNAEAVDLVGDANKIIVQVSATNTKEKIESSLKKIGESGYNGYEFKFISIAHLADDLRKLTYAIPSGIVFNPKEDIYDVATFMNRILHASPFKCDAIYEFIKKELGLNEESIKIDSDLTKVILILTLRPDEEGEPLGNPNAFKIDKKIAYNELTEKSRTIIQERSIYHQTVEQIYSEFDKEGVNKSKYVLEKIHRIYTDNKNNGLEGDDLFSAILRDVKEIVYNSANIGDLTMESIDFNSEVLVVDAFMRCRIFENPEGYQDVIA